MPTYGKVKVDTITYDLSGTATDVSVSNIATKASPTFTGTVTVPTPTAGDDSTKAASTAFVVASFATKASPTFTGTVTVPTPGADDNSTKAASTAYVQTELGDYLTTSTAASTYAPLASPTLTGSPTVPGYAALSGATFTGDVTLNAQGDLRFADSDSSNWVAFQAPATIGSNVTWTLPAADGSANQLLTTNGSGTLSWSTVAGGVSSDAQNNTVGGTNAGDSFTGTDATDNTLFGYNAGTAITTGDSNSIFGKNSGLSMTTGGRNVAVGNYCLGALTTGSQNVAIGEQCLSGDLTTGDDNIAIGNRAGYSVTGYGNVLLGYYAGYNVTSAHRCVIIGYEAGRTMTSGAHNILIGTDAGYNQTTPGTNLCIGRRAGMDITTSDGNILFGYNAGRSDSPSGSVTDESSYNTICLGNNSTTQLYCADTSISSSDSRDKTDVTNFIHGLSWINKLNPITYRWDKRTWYNEYNDDGSLKTAGTPDGSKKRERQHIGFLAQDVLAIEQADGYASKKDDMLIVNLNEDDTAYGLKYERLVPVLVNAIKELSTEVNTLKTKVAALEAA